MASGAARMREGHPNAHPALAGQRATFVGGQGPSAPARRSPALAPLRLALLRAFARGPTPTRRCGPHPRPRAG
eukprot:5346036-Pyramimonas_sp.AAC.1